MDFCFFKLTLVHSISVCRTIKRKGEQETNIQLGQLLYVTPILTEVPSKSIYICMQTSVCHKYRVRYSSLSIYNGVVYFYLKVVKPDK